MWSYWYSWLFYSSLQNGSPKYPHLLSSLLVTDSPKASYQTFQNSYQHNCETQTQTSFSATGSKLLFSCCACWISSITLWSLYWNLIARLSSRYRSLWEWSAFRRWCLGLMVIDIVCRNRDFSLVLRWIFPGHWSKVPSGFLYQMAKCDWVSYSLE